MRRFFHLQYRENIMIGIFHRPDSILSARGVFQSSDLDETRHHIGELFVPHKLEITGKRQSLHANVRHAEYSPFKFVYVRHGADVDIDPGKLKDFFMIQIPLKGTAEVRVDGQHVYCSPNQAVMLSPTLGTTMRFHKNVRHLNVRIEKDELESYLEQQIQRCLPRPLEFAPEISFKGGRVTEMLSFISFIALHLNDACSVYQNPVIKKRLSEVLLNMFLWNVEHNYTDELHRMELLLRPAYVKKALEFIHENANEAITPTDIAKSVSTSRRSLYMGFKKYLNSTPMSYLRNVRLEKVREVLLKNERGDQSVAQVAFDHGFTHMGHFSENYKNRFGELPSVTLKGASGN